MDYNAIVREKNAQIIGKVLISDLKNLPSKWVVTYNDNEVPKHADLKYLLCDSKFPLSINTNMSHWDRLVFVKTQYGELFKVRIMKNKTIWDLKTKICEIEGLAEFLQRLRYRGKEMEDCKRIGDYIYERECIINLEARQTGGGGGFCLVDLESNHVKGEGKPSQNGWSGYSVGLNSRGICSNRSCESLWSRGGKTYSRNGYGDRVLKSGTNRFNCTACNNSFIPINFIVSSARSLFRFRKTGCVENQSTILESFGGIMN